MNFQRARKNHSDVPNLYWSKIKIIQYKILCVVSLIYLNNYKELTWEWTNIKEVQQIKARIMYFICQNCKKLPFF